jgi:purine-nucleoside phosphorylase
MNIPATDPALAESLAFILKWIGTFRPTHAIITGSGLGGIATAMTDTITIPYTDIPHLLRSTAPGHAGQLILGTLAGKKTALFSGRVHYYEGATMSQVTYPVRIAHALGAGTLILTNAAGGINPQFSPGDLMLITDHINFLGNNPLIGAPRFVDMTDAYSRPLREKLIAAAQTAGIVLRQGVYLATTGPSYETPAEIRAFARLGADAVGMSTVPEVIMARYLNMDVAGISCITNMAAGLTGEKLSHEEVLATGKVAQDDLKRLLTAFIGGL